MKLGCVIMASGEGKRFGSNKMLADIYGEPLIARTIDSVPRGFDVVVSTRWPEVAQICDDKHCPCVLHDGELRSESRSVMVVFDFARQRSEPVPDAWRERLLAD